MNKFKEYPLTLSQIADYRGYAIDLFQKIKPHKDTFIDITVLEGAFLCDNPKSIYENLQIGERVSLKTEPKTNALMVYRQDGVEIGKLPFAQSILPLTLMNRGISLWAYIEAKEFKSDILEVAVSLYCENY